MANPQPKTNQKLAVRTLIGVLALGGLFYGYQRFSSLRGDLDIAPANTAGYIAAVREEPGGRRLVALDASGNIRENPGWTEGTVDRDPEWSPDGRRVYFVSDRETEIDKRRARVAHIYRWNPTTDGDPDQRTIGEAGRSLPSFNPRDKKSDALITSRGFVMAFDPTNGATRQMLPPTGREVVQAEDPESGGAGAGSQFTGIWRQLGNNFKSAKWSGTRFIAALISRDEGEVLVVQDLEAQPMKRPDGATVDEIPPPRPILAGTRIDYDISPKDGSVVATVRGFDFPTQAERDRATENGRVRRPFVNAAIMYAPEEGKITVLGASPREDLAFSSPAVAPAGDKALFVVGPAPDGEFEPRAMLISPLVEGGLATKAGVLMEGTVFEPSWNAAGTRIIFAKREGKDRALFTMAPDGSGLSRLTKAGVFFNPKFSPQSAP